MITRRTVRGDLVWALRDLRGRMGRGQEMAATPMLSPFARTEALPHRTRWSAAP